MYTFQFLQILIFLIPGFISSAILNSLIVRKKGVKELEKFIEALIFSMIIYTIYSFISNRNPITLNQNEEYFNILYDAKSFLLILLFSILIPIALSVVVKNDWHMKLLRFLRISSMTSRNSVWLDAFYDNKKFIIITFENNQRICGWPLYFSAESDNPYIFLIDAAWIDGDRFVDIDVEGILITPERKIEFIEFLKN